MPEDDHGVTVVVNPGGVAASAMTTLFIRATDTLSEFVYLNMYRGAVYLGRGTLSGSSWSFTDWKALTNESVSESDVWELKATGNHYTVLRNNKIVTEHDDVSSYPVNATHRRVGFAQEMKISILIPTFSFGLASFAARAGLINVQAVETIATQASTDASTAGGLAATANLNAAAAQTTANGVSATATAAQVAASNAASVAAAAQQKADVAYDYSAHRKEEFAVTSSGLQQGSNEQPLGVLIVFPPGAACKLERLVFTSKTNTATQVTVELIRRALNGSESVAHTTVITGGSVTFPDSTISFNATDLDHYYCNIPVGGVVGGAVTALHCAIEYFIYDPTP